MTLAMVPSRAKAHQTADSRLEVDVRAAENEVDLLALLPAVDLADSLSLSLGADGVLDPDDLIAGQRRVIAYLRGSIGARRGGKACAPSGEATLRLSAKTTSGASHVLYLETLRCTADHGPLLLHDAALFEAGRYQHLARIQVGDQVTTTVFSPGLARTSIPLDDRAGPAGRLLSTMGRYLFLGMMHIWGGIDHVLFVICLLIVARRLRGLFGVISAFTLAHTITLMASALGALSLSPRIVEPAIAASILYVALENAWAFRTGHENVATGPRRYAITFLFGLVHGFGFSYILRDQVHLPTGALVPALISFNVGVEIGQIVVIALTWPVLRWLARRPRIWRPCFIAITLVVVATAATWLTLRVLP